MALVHTISQRVAGFLEREGIFKRDEKNSYLNLEQGNEDPLQQVLSCSVTYRIATGPQQGRKVFTLQTIPAREEDDRFVRVAEEPVSACMPESRHKPGNGINWRGYAVISQDQGYQRNTCHWHTQGIPATSSKRLPMIAPRISFSSRWISSPSWRPWCRNRA